MDHALIFGASGISGWALLNQARTYPTSTTFKRITAVTRRPFTLEQARIPQDERITIASGVDLTKKAEQVAATLKDKVSDIDSVSHVFFAAYIQESDFETLKQTNTRLLETAIAALEGIAPGLKGVILQTGGKGYGLEFPKEVDLRPPFKESMPRVPEAYASKIFYYTQCDLLKEMSKGKSWTFSEIRPDGIVGFVPGSNAMSQAQGIAIYLSIYKAVKGAGATVPFPGNQQGYHSKHSDTFQDILAKMEIFAALNRGKCGNDGVFNVADGQTVSWSQVWPRLCEHWGLVGSGPVAGSTPMQAFVKQQKGAWYELAERYGLDKNLVDKQGWAHTHFMLVDFDFDGQYDLSKARSVGFEEEIDTTEGYFIAWDRMRAARILPPAWFSRSCCHVEVDMVVEAGMIEANAANWSSLSFTSLTNVNNPASRSKPISPTLLSLLPDLTRPSSNVCTFYYGTMKLAQRCFRSINHSHYRWKISSRCFSTSATRREIRNIAELPPRVYPKFQGTKGYQDHEEYVADRATETSSHDLLALEWPSPPRNILIVRKDDDTEAHSALLEYANHIHTVYPGSSLILEPYLAEDIHESLPFPVYAVQNGQGNSAYQDKIDLTTTLGGDGTILHAASLFATAKSVPPVLSFSMGTLGFLGEWKFNEYKRAFREVFVSGAPPPPAARSTDEPQTNAKDAEGWVQIRGKTMGASRNSRILLRNRLRIGIFGPQGERLPHKPPFTHADTKCDDIFALNEVLLHRGALPHLVHITILIGSPGHQRTLTTAIADGFLVSTPTGSTAYSLSSGGPIVHPLVSSMVLTPICPRSLSFRPVVLPANTPITLRIESENRGKEIEVSVDGVRRREGLKSGMDVRVVGEEVRSHAKEWLRGVPSIVRAGGAGDGEDHWVGGLNRLLKFNYPFGEDS